jgi:hypothetical protein
MICSLFEAILAGDDAARATFVVSELVAHGFHGSLTGSLAIEAHLRARGRAAGRRPLSDIDFVVERFTAIPESLADRFLLNHVHPFAPEGKTLVQLIDPERALRVDVFRAFGATVSRSGPLGIDTGPLEVVALEDLVARTTAYVYGHLRAGRAIDAKYARTFFELSNLGDTLALADAWQDHREHLSCSFNEASNGARRLLALHPEFVTTEEYSRVITRCERCQDHGRFRCAAPERAVEILGYW